MAGVIFPDIEALLGDYLRDALAARPESFASSVRVGNRVPSTWPASGRLVVIRDDGGQSLGDVRAVARVGFQVWAESEATVSDLANLACALVGAAEGVGPIRKATIARPFSVTDDAARPKQFFTAELVVRGTGL